jgi:predicted DNA-binding transcriptional regulator AlpA
MRGNDADRRHLTVEDLAGRLGVPIKTIYDWNVKGTGPRYLKIGIYCRYRLSDVLAWEKTRIAERGRVA